MRLVLDTNIVLDWLLFEDLQIAELQQAWVEQRVDLITHVPALNELQRVLTYPQFKLAQDQQTALLERYESRTRVVTLDNHSMPAGFPRCKDCDDDHFLALAYHQRADALVSKDRAVLDLAKRARKFGVTVLGPQQLILKLKDTGNRPLSS